MKTLEVTTAKGQVVLTYSEVAQKWDLFSGSQDAMNLLESMCQDMGWKWDRTKRNFFTNFVAENFELFAAEKAEKTTDSLWSNENAELEIIDNVSPADVNDLQIAFETRTKATWNLPVENYGFGCRNIDEVLTHIRYGQITDSNPCNFRVK